MSKKEQIQTYVLELTKTVTISIPSTDSAEAFERAVQMNSDEELDWDRYALTGIKLVEVGGFDQ